MKTSRRMNVPVALMLAAGSITVAAAEPDAKARNSSATPANIVLFVADGLRPSSVGTNTPAVAALKAEGVEFVNSFSVFPTLSMPNAAALATGGQPGDTGIFGNTMFTGAPITSAGDSATPFLEENHVLQEFGAQLGGTLLRTTILTAARAAGYSVAAFGKLGPTLLMLGESDLSQTLVVDESTGQTTGLAIQADLKQWLEEAGLPMVTPPGSEARQRGDFRTPGTKTPNIVQQRYYLEVITKVVLPRFKAAGKPFLLVFWSRDPGSTQQRQGDSLQQHSPGINGPTSAAAAKNADDNLASLRQALRELDLEANTNLFVVSDVGFSTISRQSRTSWAASQRFAHVMPGLLPPGMLAIDLAHDLGTELHDPEQRAALIDASRGAAPQRANGFIGPDAQQPEVIVAENGGSDLIYLPKKDAARTARRIVPLLLRHDYVGGVFIDRRLGNIPGTLPFDRINLHGPTATISPSMVISFRSFAGDCGEPVRCALVVADTTYQQGHGVRGSFGRADTHNFMAVFGPHFKRGFVDRAPASTADIGRTIFHLLNASAPYPRRSRVLAEAFRDGREPAFDQKLERGARTPEGVVPMVRYQQIRGVRYLEAAGDPQRTLGLADEVRATVTAPASASARYAGDRAMIENLLARYAFAFDWRRADDYAATFTEDGELDYAGGILKGRDALRAMINAVRAEEQERARQDPSGKWPPRKRHFVTSLLLEIHGDRATARAYWSSVINDNPDRHPVIAEYGHYEDELIKHDGQWLFSKRRTFNETAAERISRD